MFLGKLGCVSKNSGKGVVLQINKTKMTLQVNGLRGEGDCYGSNVKVNGSINSNWCDIETSTNETDNRKIGNGTTTSVPHVAKPKSKILKESFEPPPFLTAILTQISFSLIMLLSFISQFCTRFFYPPKAIEETGRSGYPPLFDRFSMFYSRYVYRRIRDCWNYPICSVPGSEVVLKDRVTNDCGWTFEFTGTQTKCLNLASYNYLGFAESSGPCAEAAIASIYQYGISSGSSRCQYGTQVIHDELEELLAEYLGVEDAITFGMGFATNALNIPTLIEPGCLVISDEKNHASLIWGIKIPGATVKVFKHNDMTNLEQILKEAVCFGQSPKGAFKPWKKILIIVEGVYSMEGTIVKLPEVIALKKKYKAYLYLDEAHSIGAMGKHGRGVIDYFGCDPNDVDILMGTFTKSFGSAGGYIAGSKELITYLREFSLASCHAWAMAPPLAAQIIAVLNILMEKDGTKEGQRRIEALARNTRYFRMRLNQIGVIIHGNEDSPVVPILVYLYSKIAGMVRSLIKEKIATVGVGYPATPLYEGRIRICLSAGHTKEQLDYALEVIEKVADEIGLKYSRKPKDLTPIEYDKIKVYQD